MLKLRQDACAAHGIDFSHLADNQMFGFPGHRYFAQEQNVIHTQKLLDQIIAME
jgi:hypothetical protein